MDAMRSIAFCLLAYMMAMPCAWAQENIFREYKRRYEPAPVTNPNIPVKYYPAPAEPHRAPSQQPYTYYPRYNPDDDNPCACPPAVNQPPTPQYQYYYQYPRYDPEADNPVYHPQTPHVAPQPAPAPAPAPKPTPQYRYWDFDPEADNNVYVPTYKPTYPQQKPQPAPPQTPQYRYWNYDQDADNPVPSDSRQFEKPLFETPMFEN